MPDGMGVDDPVDRGEVEQLKSHTGGHQEHSSYPIQYVRTIPPEWLVTNSIISFENQPFDATHLCRKNQASQEIQLRPPEATLTFTVTMQETI